MKTLKVTVVKKSGDKTVKCRAVKLTQHPIYKKYYKVYNYYLVHDADNSAKIGDEVVIIEGKSISKRKSWSIFKKGK